MGDALGETITRLLRRFQDGDRSAFDRTVHLLYDELHRIARIQRQRWNGDHTLGTTALCHEAYLKMAGNDPGNWTERAHFLSVAARAMRQILIDYSRAKKREKRGGEGKVVLALEEVEAFLPALGAIDADRAETMLTLEEGLRILEEASPRHARIVECRFFAGMTIRETAEALDISPTSVKRGWALAQTWLHRFMFGEDRGANGPSVEQAS